MISIFRDLKINQKIFHSLDQILRALDQYKNLSNPRKIDHTQICSKKNFQN